MADQTKKPVAGTAIGLAGACAAALTICTPLIASFEGKRNTSYRDIVGVVTACYGHTGSDIRMGQVFDDGQCRAMLQTDIGRHMQPVVACTPGLTAHPNALAAATSLAFNIGAAAYCGSTIARRFNAGDLKDGCDAFLVWDRAGGRAVPGLARRRAAERALCLKGTME